MSLAIIIPTKREAERLKTLFPVLKKTIPEAEIYIINTPVPEDKTKEVAEEFGANYYENPAGFGTCLAHGLLVASAHDYVITMDADHDPVSARLMYDNLVKAPEKYILAIGIEGSDRIQRDVVNFMMRVLLGINLHNPTCGLRCYRGSSLWKVIPKEPDEWFFIQIQLVYNVIMQERIMKEGKILEIPFPPANHTGVTENTRFYKLFFKGLIKLWWSEITTSITSI